MSKKKMSPEKIKKLWVKNLRIWRKILKYVRIVEDAKGNYEVQTRKYYGIFSGMGEWYTLNMYSSYGKAVERRNMYVVMVIMRDMGYRNEFVKRRTDRKRKAGLI
jgi:hypothetical protein